MDEGALEERLRSLLSEGLDHALRPTDESHHHQQRLARRLEIASSVYSSWTGKENDASKLASKIADGSVDNLRSFVTEKDEDDGVEATSTVTVEVRDAEDLSYEEFWLRYMFENKPVLVSHIGREWRATREWTDHNGALSLGALSEAFGDAQVWVTHCTSTAEKSAGERERWTVREYIENYWRKDEGDRGNRSLYLKDWHFPTEFADYGAYETPKYFRDDWLNEYYDHLASNAGPGGAGDKTDQQALECSDYRFLYMGPKGTKTGLHADVLRSFSWSINISGRKRWFLLPPRYTHLLYDTFGHNIAPAFFGVDEEAFPNVAAARKYLVEVVQGVGEAIFVPSGWHHTVENLEDTLSINHNWFNACNVHYAVELLQRERHEAEQAICDCRELVASEEEFEELVQRNVAANASMDYENFAYLLVMVAVSRARALVEEDSVEDLESLMRAYEAKMACAAVRPLVGRITSKEAEAEILKSMDFVKASLPHVNWE